MNFTFPDVGEGITEGEIVQWHVSEGDQVEADQTLVEIETDKAIVDIPSPVNGVIERIPFSEGSTIKVGDLLVEFDTDEDVEQEEIDAEELMEDAGGNGSGDDQELIIESEDDREGSIELEVESEEESTSVVGSISTEAEVLEGEEHPESARVPEEKLATPSTRRLARELGVDLQKVDGSGQGGRITDEDVRVYASDAVKDEDEQVRHGEDEYGPVTRKTLSGVRKAIAQRMRASAFEIPQVTHMDEADVTDLQSLVEEKREELSGELDVKLTLTPFFVKTVANLLKEYPMVNATLDKDEDEIIMKKYVNIGVGVDTESGLMVPVVRDADEKDVLEIAHEIKGLADRCRSRDIELEEMRGGTFTITNIGFVGGKWATPKINYPEAAIMATGRAEKSPVVRDDEVVIRRMLPLSLSFDHRLLDGAEIARFTNDVKDMLESPETFSL
ncbi:MAG: dihydrolipoamide acetyltransferase family protein [bacterium]